MTAGSTPPAPATGAAVFEVERFEWTAPDRLEVAGRWSGVRGLRFMRPTLDLPTEGRRRRLLALLDHKPWAPDEGEEWIAAFPWEGDPVDTEGAELAVTPAIAVTLPPPHVPGRKRKRAPTQKAPRFERATAHNPELLDRARDAAVIERAAIERQRDAAVRERDAALAELKARGPSAPAEDVEELRRERDAALNALGRREAAAGEVSELRRERDAALAELRRAADELEQLRRRRDDDSPLARLTEAEASRDAAQGEADALRTRADELLERTARAEAAHTVARQEADELRRGAAALEGRVESAEAARAELAREREAILRGAREALGRVEAAEAAAGAIAAERDEALAERDAAYAARDEVQAEPAVHAHGLVAPIAPPPARRRRRERVSSLATWGPRLAALGALVFLLIVLALLFRGI